MPFQLVNLFSKKELTAAVRRGSREALHQRLFRQEWVGAWRSEQDRPAGDLSLEHIRVGGIDLLEGIGF